MLITTIFHRFEQEKIHPNIVQSHLGNFLINICTLVKEMGGMVEAINSKERLMAIHISNINIIRLKIHFEELALSCAQYINDLKKSSSIVNQVKQYVEKNYSKNLKLKDMGELLYMNPAYLGQLFKKETGVSFSHYVNNKRLQKARKLLVRTDLPIYRVAEQVGYQNVDYFICKFKESENCTPLEYKKNSIHV